ncbi:MAG: ATP-binding protein [Ferruginibacter sp.]
MDNDENIKCLNKEMDWLQDVVNQVVKSYLMQEGHEQHWLDIPVPDLAKMDTPYAMMVKKWGLNVYARLALVLAMAPHFKPEVLDILFGKNQMYDRGFTEFGGLVDKNHSGFLPTGQTFCFLVTATNPEIRYEVLDVLSKQHVLLKEQVIILDEPESYLPRLDGMLILNEHWFHYFLTGEFLQVENTASFPARRITTNMEWEDIVLSDQVMEQLNEISTWIEHGQTLMEDWGLAKRLKPGYRALFYGPPGTGKTLAATILGKASGREVYRVDLSMAVSKYIGETEKNLSKVFDIAKDKNWILFFDEADALFGKRTQTHSSNDRYANQEVAYLLQRVEDYPGIVILASDFKDNIDEAFSRRFQAIVHFDMPGKEERLKLWKGAFSDTCKLDPVIDLNQIAEEFELSGGSIVNILRYCAGAAISRGHTVVTEKELMTGLRRAFKKENRTLNVKI